MRVTPATVLGARKVAAVEGQLDLFGPEDDTDTAPEEPPASTTSTERTTEQ